jgi:small subunit ribosomal protein S17
MADPVQPTAPARRMRKTQIGIVTSNKMQKTVVVQVQRLIRHAKYKKYVKRLVKFKAHDENQTCQPGDKVLLVETRPISKEKRWKVQQILERAA